MICDPSHICGNRTMLGEISQQAADLNYDGLMIESHISPDEAWSDAKQQITPEALVALLDNIKWRAGESQSHSYQIALMGLREQIDSLDREILQLLAERMDVAEKIGQIKRENDVRILQPSRWEDIMERALTSSSSLGLSEQFLRTILDAVHIESIDRQNKVMND